jgi:hypothetical protein
VATRQSTRKIVPPTTRKLHLLELIPALAIREFLVSRMPSDDNGRARLSRLTHQELVRQVEADPSITEEQVEQLFEDYRYGQRISLQLYLFDPAQPRRLSAGQLRTDLVEALVTQDESKEAEETDAERDGYEAEAPLNTIIVRDDDEFDGTLEIGYKYLVRHGFLDEDEDPAFVYQTRFGFLWLNYDKGYLAILAGNDHITNLVAKHLIQVLQFWPTKIKFPKEILDEYFPFEKARRVTHFDPATRVRQTISGETTSLDKYRAEIKLRDKSSLRPGALYDEELEPGYVSGVGVTASKGQIYLTRTISASRLRKWAVKRLPKLVAGLREYLSSKPDEVAQPSPAVRRLRLSDQGRTQIDRIISALVHLKKQQLSSVTLPMNAWELMEGLESRVTPFIQVSCDECDGIADRCYYCHETAFAACDGRIVCGRCGHDLVTAGRLRLRCINGHKIQTPLADALGVQFASSLVDAIVSAVRGANVAWDDEHETFFVQGDTLYYMVSTAGRPIEIIYGDKIIAHIGPNARQVAVGKQIVQEGVKQNG